MRRALSRLAARGLTAYLLFAYAVFLVFLAIWGARVPAAVVENISRLPPFAILYVAAGIHLLCCLVIFWPVLVQRTSLEVPGNDPGLLLRVTPFVVLAAAKSQGFRSKSLPGGAAALVRNRWSSVGTFAFHTALLLIPIAFFVSRTTRFTGEAWIVEGHPFHGTRPEYTRVEPADGFSSRAPTLSFDVEKVEAEFWGDRLFFTDLRALLTLREPSAGTRWVRLPQPVWVDGARVSLRGFNYTPAIEVRDHGGEILESADVSLWLFPPGTEDSFAIPGLPHRFWVRLYPDSGGPDSRPVNKGHDLKRPLFHIAVTVGKRLVTHGWLRVGEPLSFDGYRISVPEIRNGGEIVVHRDLGYPILWVALLIAAGGSIARITFPASRIFVLSEGSGARVIVRDDPFAGDRATRLLARWMSDAR
ncbi:MAG TPA: cytochrome c biogenesis protein ResB [Thermoanaerobaculia bacterium]|nr:cytochrome c biogenesis protein ResB [Thermoanaerobaculia bacterium]